MNESEIHEFKKALGRHKIMKHCSKCDEDQEIRFDYMFHVVINACKLEQEAVQFPCNCGHVRHERTHYALTDCVEEILKILGKLNISFDEEYNKSMIEIYEMYKGKTWGKQRCTSCTRDNQCKYCIVPPKDFSRFNNKYEFKQYSEWYYELESLMPF